MTRVSSRKTVCAVALALLVLGTTCAAQHPLRDAADGLPELPRPAASYATKPHAQGLRGDGADAVADLVRAHVRGRDADADGALATAAVWALRAAYEQRIVDTQQVENVARRFGFAGVVYITGTNSLDQRDHASFVDELMQGIPRNHRLTRYGVAAARDGRDMALVLGAVEASLEPFARTMRPGASVTLRGEVAERFQRAGVFVTDTRGVVREIPVAARAIDAEIRFDDPGVHQIEVVGYGSDGVTVLINVPLWVGIAEPEVDAPAAPAAYTFDPAVAEARLLELINADRKRAGLGDLLPDAELRTVALGHAEDMAKNNFASHVSPTTGTLDDRMRRANLRISLAGENIAVQATPEGTHRGLMGSPAHRANILGGRFTHVGIGVVIRTTPRFPQLYVTQVFGRRPAPSEMQPSSDALVKIVLEARRARGLGAARVDPVLQRAADAGLRAYLGQQPRSRERSAHVASANINAHAQRTRQDRPAVCISLMEILEGAQLSLAAQILDPNLKAFGLAAAVAEKHETPRTTVMLISQGTFKAAVACR